MIMEKKISWDDIPTLSLASEEDSEDLLTDDESRRAAVRLSSNELKKMLLETPKGISIQIATRRGILPQKGTLQDLSQSGICFIMPDHGLQKNETIKFFTIIGKRPLKSRAIVRWTNKDMVGLEFVDPNPEDVGFLAELYSAMVLNRF